MKHSTATGAGNKYDKAEDYAHDVTLLVVSVVSVRDAASAVKQNLKLFKSAAQDLAGWTARPKTSDLANASKSAGLISSMDDFTDYAEGFLDEDALQYVREALGDDADDSAQLKKIARLVEDGSKKIGKKLSKEEVKAGLDALWDDAGVEGALAAIERVVSGGLDSPQTFLQKALKNQGLNDIPDAMKEVWLEGDYKYTVRIHQGDSKYTEAKTVYRVARKSTILNGNNQGSGLEYLGIDGNWYQESVLKEFYKNGNENPLFNELAAKMTYIPIGEN